jgi:hypothetical protein
LWAGGYVRLEPPPPPPPDAAAPGNETPAATLAVPAKGSFGAILLEARAAKNQAETRAKGEGKEVTGAAAAASPPGYEPRMAYPTPELSKLLVFRSVNPLYGAFLLKYLGIADREERVQALESVLDVPTSLLRDVRVPAQRDLPPGSLATTVLDQLLIQRGLVTAEQLRDKSEERGLSWEERWSPTLAEKLRLLFDSEFPGVHDLSTRPVWIAGEALRYGGDFNKLVTAKSIVRQEGVVFRHLLRFILLCEEFSQLTPDNADADEWRADLAEISRKITECCRAVDPESTDKAIEIAHSGVDLIRGEAAALEVMGTIPPVAKAGDEFGSGLD